MAKQIQIPRCLLCLLVIVFIGLPLGAAAKSIDDLRAELNMKRKSLQATERKIKEFKQSIQQRKREARTLEDQIILIDDSIQVIELNIQRTLEEIETTDVEIQTTQQEIDIKEQEIQHQKELLAELIRSIHLLDQQSSVTIYLKYNTFSEALSESATLQELQNRGQETLVAIKNLHQELLTKRRELEDFKNSLEALKRRQQDQQQTLENQRASKKRILDLTNEQEAQYKSLLSQAQQAHKQAQAAIRELDTRIRKELRKQGVGNLPSVGTLDWPIEPIFGISCGFHCPNYPYEHLIGPHTAIDMPTYVGTPIKAAADGYVARTFDSGGPGYSYIMLIHGDEVSTVYGHVSGFAVNEGQMISRGTVIGYTGGAPGTRGSGLSSGPHLHFEVRKNNLPTDPIPFLPSL